MALSDCHPMLCVVAEHNCSVTVEGVRSGFSDTIQVKAYYTVHPRLDTLNFYTVPPEEALYIDSLLNDSDSQPGFAPQNKALHITSTDTISVALLVHSLGSMDIIQLLPTHLLRDEYVVQSFPHTNGVGVTFFDVIAAEDNTTVDIVLSDDDWAGRQAGDTLTVSLQRGQMLHVAGKCPDSLYHAYIPNQGFPNNTVEAVLPIVDLSGTYVKARDNRRIAIIEGNRGPLIPLMDPISGTENNDATFEMAVPLSFAGKNFVVPNISYSDTEYLRFTALEDNTTITVTDVSGSSNNNTRTLQLNALQTEWFRLGFSQGPFYISSSEPLLLALFTMGNNVHRSRHTYGNGDPAMLIVKPVEWWNSNPIRYHTPYYFDHRRNIYAGKFETYLFARTEDVPYITIDNSSVSDAFTPMAGTPFSYAYFDYRNQINSQGVHQISCSREGYFMAVGQQFGTGIHALWTLPHVQPLNCHLTVDGVSAERLTSDTRRCIYDTIVFRGWSGQPGDSIFWDLGDGIHYAFDYDHGQEVRHRYADTGLYEVHRVITWRTESADGCYRPNDIFHRPPDTMSASLQIRHHYDSTFSVRLCEGSYFFRGREFDHTDTFHHTTYWSPSGCDTLWTIDLVTCPHCAFDSDTINLDQLPWSYNGFTFRWEEEGYPVHINISDTCDSIVYYTLVVIRPDQEEPLDSVIIMVPNVFTPLREDNNRFSVVANRFISDMRVWVYDRQGMLVKEFDGLSENWDGTKEGRPLPQGTYVYYIRYHETGIVGWKTLKGTVTLLR